MLQSIRNHTQGWIAGIIISLLILSFSLWGIHSYFVGDTTATAVAKVNGVEITRGQLAVAYERLRRQLQIQFSSSYELPQYAETALKERALQALINIQVLRQASLKRDYYISPSQVDSYLESMPEFQVDGQFSLPRFQQLLSTTLFNANDFLNLIKTTLLIDQPRLGIIFTSFPLPNEVSDAIALLNQERDIQYTVLSSQHFLNEPITVPEDKVLTYYQQHQEDFKTPEQASIQYIELSLKNLINTFHPTNEKLKSFYDENTNSFTQPARWKLESISIPLSENAAAQQITQAENEINKIYSEAQRGKDFAAIAKQYGIPKEELKVQDDVTLNQVPEDLQKILLTIVKPGQIAKPIRTNQGFTLLKTAAFKEAIINPFEKVKDKVKEALVHQQAEEMYANLKEKLANLTYEHPDSLEPAAKALGLTIKTTDSFTKDKGAKDITASNKIREAAFSNDVLNLQNNSDVIQISSDTAVVLRVKTHVPPTLLSLKIVQPQIIDKIKAALIDTKTLQLANQLLKKLEKGADPEALASHSQLTWEKPGLIGRHSTKIDSAILNAAFEMPKLRADRPTAYAIAKVPQGYAIIRLISVKEGVLTNTENYDVYEEQIQNTQGLLEYELYKQSLMKQAKIVLEN